MASQILAVVAAAGLLGAGIASANETRSASALPYKTAKSSMGQNGARCYIGDVEGRVAPTGECVANNSVGSQASTAARSGGGNGAVLAVLIAAVGAGGLAVALANDSNG